MVEARGVIRAWRRARPGTQAMASFYGTFRNSIDHKGRMSVPAPWRREMSGGRRAAFELFLTVGLDGELRLFTSEEWQPVEGRLRQWSVGDREQRAFARAFLGDVHKVTVDGQGRITIPPSLMSRAGLGREAVLRGNVGKIEIWSPERAEQAPDLDGERREDLWARMMRATE